MIRAYPCSDDCLPCARRGLVIDGYCRHDDVDLDVGKDEHLIECNQCGTWWQCYGELEVVWGQFLKYGRLDESDPSTVNVVCEPQAWPATKDKVGSGYVAS